MKLRKLGGVLVVTLSVTGCGSGLSGAGVVGETNAQGGNATASSSNVVSLGRTAQFGGPDNLVRNGSFERGVAPWVPFSNSKVALTHSVHRFGRFALLARPQTKRPARLGAALVDLVARPAYGSSYSFTAWVRASPRGSLAIVELSALHHHKEWVRVGEQLRRITGGWQRFTVRGKVLVRHAVYLRATVAVNDIASNSWLAIDGAKAKILSAGGSRR